MTSGNAIVENYNKLNEDAEGFSKEILGKEYDNKLDKVESGYDQVSANALTRAGLKGAGVSSTSMNAQTKTESQKQKDLFNTDLGLQEKAISQANVPHQQAIMNANRNYSMINGITQQDERGVFGKLFEAGTGVLGATIPFLGSK